MVGTLIGAIVAGLIIGALGRLLVPGKQNISILVTIIIGIVASLAATAVLLWRSPQWAIAVDVPVVADASLNIHRVRFEKRGVAFEAVMARMPRNAARAKLVDVAEGQSLADVAKAGGASLAINAGYFDDNFAPVGFLRIDGRDTGTLLAQPPLSGLVVIDSGGAVDIVDRDLAALSSAASAFQTGPFLIEPGGGDGIHANDEKSAERTVLALSGTDVFVIVTTPVTLSDLADALIAAPLLGGPAFDRAINLDGGPSSGFVIDAMGSHVQRLPRGRIRNAILFNIAATNP